MYKNRRKTNQIHHFPSMFRSTQKAVISEIYFKLRTLWPLNCHLFVIKQKCNLVLILQKFSIKFFLLRAYKSSSPTFKSLSRISVSFLQEDIAFIRAPISKKVEFCKWKRERFGKFCMSSTVKEKKKRKNTL